MQSQNMYGLFLSKEPPLFPSIKEETEEGRSFKIPSYQLN